MNRSFFVRAFIVFFLAGIGLGPFLDWRFVLLGSAMSCSLFFLFLNFGFVFPYAQKRLWQCASLIAFAAFLFGFGRFLISVPAFTPQDVAFYIGLPFEVEIAGEITGEPYLKNGSLSVVMEANAITFQQKTVRVHGTVQLKLLRYPFYQYGDQLKIKGLLEKPLFQSGDTYAVLNRPRVISHSSASTINPFRLLFAFKNFLLQRLNQLFTEPDASLAGGILLGARSNISPDLLADFNRVGLTHILAISGYNITLIIQLLALALKTLPRTFRFIITVLFLFVFSLLTGFSASVIRAALMGVLTLSGSLFYRRSQGLQILLLSAFFMVLITPSLLLSDISFQLSFLATLGLLLFMPFFEKLEGIWLKIPSFFKEGLLVTVAAQLLTIPITLFHFGRLSLVSFLSNVALLPVVPFLMFFSFAALLCSLLWLWPLTVIMVASYWLCDRFLLGGVSFFAAVPFASIEISFFPWWICFLYYFLLAVFFFQLQKKFRNNRKL